MAGSADFFADTKLGDLIDPDMLFCACEVQAYAVSGVTLTWGNHRHLKWGTTVQNLDSIPHMDFRDCVDAVCKEFASRADVSLTYTADPSKANLLIVEQSIDGPSGILGDCQMPVRPNPGTQLMLRIDKTDRFVISDRPNPGEIDAYTFLGHEMEHFWGLGHQPASIQKPARIKPIYDIACRYMQDADWDEFWRRYPIVTPKPADPKPAPGAKPVIVRLDNEGAWCGQDGKEWFTPWPATAKPFTGMTLTLPRVNK